MPLRCRSAAVCVALFCAAIGAGAQLLTEPVGTTSLVQIATVTIATGGTLSVINVMTQGAPNLDFNFVSGGTCKVGMSYTANQTCTVYYTFTPTHPGLRFGGISLSTAATVLLGNAYVQGLGTGPQVTYSPAAQSLLGGFYSYPTGVAVDGAGDVFLSDENGNSVSEVPAATGVSRLLGNFMLPDDVAVDGCGNVFVIYNRNALAEIFAVNGTIPLNPTWIVISTNFAALNGMKVDGKGNIYLASSYGDGSGSMIQEVLSVNGSIPANPTVLTLVSNVGGPTGVAIDAAGNIYISDEIGNAAWEVKAVNGVIPPSPTVVQLAGNLTSPSNIAVDAAGNVFVSEMGGIAEIVAVNGVIPASPTVLILGTKLTFPQGLAVDSSGNIFVADDATPQAVKLDFADAPQLTFATTAVGSTSTDSPQTVTLGNDGNANLIWTSLPSGADPAITPGFTFTSTCPVLSPGPALSYAMVPGASCAEKISFTPVALGLNSGKWTLTDNNLNGLNAQQNILLSGNGTIATSYLAMTLTPNPVYPLQAFTVLFTLTLGSSTGTPDAGQPLTLTYNPGTGPVVINLTTDANGNASYTFAGGLHAGNYLISVSFAGNSSQKPSSISNTEVVNLFPTTSVLTVAPAAPVTTDNVVLTATVSAPLATSLLTGTLTLFKGAISLGTVALNASAIAQLSIGNLAAGTYTFTCMYNGVQDYATSLCAPVTVTVIPPPDFSLMANPPSITIETQHHSTMQLTLTAIGSFVGRVQLGCQGPLPPYVTCELPPGETLTVGQTLSFPFTMDTDAVLNFLAQSTPAATPRQTGLFSRIALALLLPLALTSLLGRRRLLRGLLLLMLLAVGATGLTACGNKWPAHTPPGTYTIPVVGTGTAPNGTVITHTLNITLTVTP
jgi:sugar lactone lactonase YvrE